MGASRQARIVWQDMKDLGEHLFVALVEDVPKAVVFFGDSRWVSYVEGAPRRFCRSCEDAKRAAERILKA